jgi:hypothetical protein
MQNGELAEYSCVLPETCGVTDCYWFHGTCCSLAECYRFHGICCSVVIGWHWSKDCLTQDRVWTADRLQKRGWPNCGVCQLCKRKPESAAHLLFKCRYYLRIWNSLLSCLRIISVDTSNWPNFVTVEDWWLSFIFVNGTRRTSFASLIMLTSWEIWNERNARVFRKAFHHADGCCS